MFFFFQERKSQRTPFKEQGKNNAWSQIKGCRHMYFWRKVAAGKWVCCVNLFWSFFSNTCTCLVVWWKISLNSVTRVLCWWPASRGGIVISLYCVVPDNIHTPAPPHGGQRNFRGGGGGGRERSKRTQFSRGWDFFLSLSFAINN